MFDKLMLFFGMSLGLIGAGFNSLAIQDSGHKMAFQIAGMVLSALATAAMAFAPKVSGATTKLTAIVTLGLLSFAASGCAIKGQNIGDAVQTVTQMIGVKGHEIDKPGLADAKVKVWRFYGESSDPPQVLIVEGYDLDCAGGHGFYGVTYDGNVDRQCLSGFTFTPLAVSIAYHDETDWSLTSLAHEYMHASQSRHLVFQGNHLGYTGPDWGQGGRVDQANTLLRGSP